MNGVEGIVIFIAIPGKVAIKKGFPPIEELVLELSECITIGNKKSKTPCIHYADIKDNKGNYRLALFFPVGTTKEVYHGTITNIAVLLKDKYHELWQALLKQ